MLQFHRSHGFRAEPQEGLAPSRQARAAVKTGLTTAGIALGAGVLWGVYQIAQWQRKKK